MFNSRFIFKITVIVSCFFAFSAIANAQATRTWVSGVGDDVNPCSRTAPCKTFAGAISKTATNGEINCLDPAGYGAVTITKSITIDCEDTQGSILSAGTTGVIINLAAGDAKKSVRLRGLSINGAATGIHGVRVLATANNIALEEVIIDGVTTHGVSIETTSGSPKVSIDSCSMRNAGSSGINTFIIGGTLTLSISNSRLNANLTGLNLSSNTNATVSTSVINGNTNGATATNATMAILASSVSHNTTAGVTSATGGTVRISGCLITGNGTGLVMSGGGTITSYTTNVLHGNLVADGIPTFTIARQ